MTRRGLFAMLLGVCVAPAMTMEDRSWTQIHITAGPNPRVRVTSISSEQVIENFRAISHRAMKAAVAAMEEAAR